MLTGAVTAAIAVALAGCTAPGTGYADLEGDPAAGHDVPAALAADLPEEMDAESLRWVGDHDDVQLWLSRRAELPGICALAFVDDEDWSFGCGTGTLTFYGDGVGTFAVLADGMSPPEHAVPVSENVFALESDVTG